MLGGNAGAGTGKDGERMLTRDVRRDLYEKHLEELRRRFDPEGKRGVISLA